MGDHTTISPWHQTLGVRKKAILLAPALAHVIPIKSQRTATAPSSAPQPMHPPSHSAWTGTLHMTRSHTKRATFSATLMHGELLGVELVLKAMANDTNSVLNIMHRIPFEEIQKPERTIMSILGLAPKSREEWRIVEEYCEYFRRKQRAGSLKLDDCHSLYIVPPTGNATTGPNARLYALSPNIAQNALLAVVCKMTPQRGEKRNEPSKEVTQDMIVDLFTNPELIALLQK